MQKRPHLLVFRFSSLGDVAMLTPVLRVLYQTYPDLEITLVSRPFVKPIFDEFPKLSFFSLDLKGQHQGVKGLWKLYLSLRKLQPTGVADIHDVLRTKVLRFFFKILGPFRVKKIDKKRRRTRKLMRKKGKQFQPLTPVIYRYADVFRKLGYPIDLATHVFPDRPSLPKMGFLNNGKIVKNKIGIAPFASYLGKKYPLDLMQKVVGFLSEKHQIFLFGSGDKEANQLSIWDKAFSNAFNVSERLNLGEQIKLMANLDLMIAMDSANGHLAANWGVPVLTIWGMTHPFAGFKPFGQPDKNQLIIDRSRYPQIPASSLGDKIPKGYENAFRSIVPRTIIERVLKIIEENNR